MEQAPWGDQQQERARKMEEDGKKLFAIFEDAELVDFARDRVAYLTEVLPARFGVTDWAEPCRNFLRWCDQHSGSVKRTAEQRYFLFLSGRDEAATVIMNLIDPAYQQFCLSFLEPGEKYPEPFAQHISQWSQWLTPDLAKELLQHRLENTEQESALSQLFLGRLSWMQALAELAVEPEELQEKLTDSEITLSFLIARESATLSFDQNAVDYVSMKESARTPIEGDATEEGRHVMDLLSMTNFDVIMKRTVSKLVLTTYEKMNADGNFSNLDASLSIAIDVEASDRYMIPGTLFNEVGHAVNRYLALLPNGQELFDRYAVATVYKGAYSVSEYPAGLAEMEGQESKSFLREAFAEDFRILLTEASLLPEERLKRLELIFNSIFPDLVLEELRQRTRSAYGTLYGKSVKEDQRPVRCTEGESFAAYMARRKSELDRSR
jgi:hypothetical protein